MNSSTHVHFFSACPSVPCRAIATNHSRGQKASQRSNRATNSQRRGAGVGGLGSGGLGSDPELGVSRGVAVGEDVHGTPSVTRSIPYRASPDLLLRLRERWG